MTRFAIILPCLLAGCPSPSKPAIAPTETVAIQEDEASRLARLLTELQDDILTSYERDEPPEITTGMVDPKVGAARIGAGPGDAYTAGDLARAPSRWPLDVDRATRTEVRSKHLEIEIAADHSAAWMADELSWRIELCGRTAVIPLRITALYAHDGDRWVAVFEHVSYGWPPPPRETQLPKPIPSAVASAELETALLAVVDRGVLRVPHDPTVIAQEPLAVVLGPDVNDEWHGAQVLSAQLPAGKLEGRRIGTVGRSGQDPTVAYWVGNYLTDAPTGPEPGGKVGMRVSFVFEKRLIATRDKAVPQVCVNDPKAASGTPVCRWILVQSQMSRPISDDELTTQVFGTALVSPKPLTLECPARQ